MQVCVKIRGCNIGEMTVGNRERGLNYMTRGQYSIKQPGGFWTVQKSVTGNQREKGVEKAHMSRIINDGGKKSIT